MSKDNHCDDCWTRANEIAFDSAYELDEIYLRLLSECEHHG